MIDLLLNNEVWYGFYMVAANTPLNSLNYVAILKAKRGELRASKESNLDHFIPLFEVLDNKNDLDSNKIVQVNKGSSNIVWVQLMNYRNLNNSSWPNRITDYFTKLHNQGCAAVPVVTSDENQATYNAVGNIVAVQQRGLVIRIDCEETPTNLSTVSSRVKRALKQCGVSEYQCDIIVDAGFVSGTAIHQASTMALMLNEIPNISLWRSVVASFSGFPSSVGDVVSANSVQRIPRTDAFAFNALTKSWTDRKLVFSDYGVGVPTYSNVNWAPIPNIRYTIPDYWVIHRAAQQRTPGPQYVQLAKSVVNAPYFQGSSFSSGDQYLNDVALAVDGPGNAETYLRVAMNHHFAQVLDSLATHGAP